MYPTPAPAPPPSHEHLRLEAVTVSVGFDDLLDVTLALNHPHLDSLIVVTSHADKRTQGVCAKHGAVCVQTDLFQKNGRRFNKGAAINAGFGYFQYHGWRLHLDADILLPDNFRRLLFNHHHLDHHAIYGADRVDVVGRRELAALRAPQHQHRCLLHPRTHRPIGARFVSHLHGYLPIGYFQLWHASCQHDWPLSQRRLLPGVLVYHLCAREPTWSENWDGVRKQPRWDRDGSE